MTAYLMIVIDVISRPKSVTYLTQLGNVMALMPSLIRLGRPKINAIT